MGLREKAKLMNMGLREKATFLIEKESLNRIVDEINENIVDKVDYIDHLHQFVFLLNSWEKEFHFDQPVAQSQMDEVIRNCLNAMRNFFGIESAAILLDNEKNNLILTQSIGLDKVSQEKYTLSKDNESLQPFFINPAAMLLDNYQENDEIKDGLSKTDLESTTHFFFMLPLMECGKLFGALNIFSLTNQTTSSISQKELHLLSLVGSYLSHFMYRFLRLDKGTVQEKSIDKLASFLTFLEKEMEAGQEAREPFTLFSVRFTHIQQYIAKHGIKQYQMLLSSMAEQCKQQIENEDYFYHYSINQFLLYCPKMGETKTATEKAYQIMESLKISFGNDFPLGLEPYSVRHACFPFHGRSLIDLLNYIGL